MSDQMSDVDVIITGEQRSRAIEQLQEQINKIRAEWLDKAPQGTLFHKLFMDDVAYDNVRNNSNPINPNSINPNSMTIPFVTGAQSTCFYLSLAEALGISNDPKQWKNLIKPLMEGLLNSVIQIIRNNPGHESLHSLSFQMQAEMGLYVGQGVSMEQVISAYTASKNYTNLKWGGDLEMMMLSWLTNGRLVFLTFDCHDEPKRIGFIPNGITEVQMDASSFKVYLAYCNYNGAYGGNLNNHYQLLKYTLNGVVSCYLPPSAPGNQPISFKNQQLVQAYSNSLRTLATETMKRENKIRPLEVYQHELNVGYFNTLLESIQNQQSNLTILEKMQKIINGIIHTNNQELLLSDLGHGDNRPIMTKFIKICGFSCDNGVYRYRNLLVSRNCINTFLGLIQTEINDLSGASSSSSSSAAPPLNLTNQADAYQLLLHMPSAAPPSNLTNQADAYQLPLHMPSAAPPSNPTNQADVCQLLLHMLCLYST